MENEEDKTNFLITNNIFKKDYENQKLNDSNLKFFNWKKSMQKIYGENAILFKCIKDNIYFFASYEECMKHPVYKSICPKCNVEICYYCSRNLKDKYYNENGTCCLRRKIKCMFNQECYRYINPINQEDDIHSFKTAFTLFIIPVISLLTIIAQIQGILYYKLYIKNGKNKQIVMYYEHLKYYSLVELINMGLGIILVIPLFIIHIYFILFILLISLPFNFIPLKYILGLHYATINLLGIFCCCY